MLLVTTDRNLPASDRRALYTSTLARLHTAARRVADEVVASLDDADKGAGWIGDEAARLEVLDRLVLPLGGGRVKVDPDLFDKVIGDDVAGLVVDGETAADLDAEESADTDGDALAGEPGDPAEGLGDGPGLPEVGGAVTDEVVEPGEHAPAGEDEAGSPEPEPDEGTPVAETHDDDGKPTPAPAFDPAEFPNIEALREFAREHSIDLHGASLRAEVEQAITDGLAARESAPTDPAGDAG